MSITHIGVILTVKERVNSLTLNIFVKRHELENMKKLLTLGLILFVCARAFSADARRQNAYYFRSFEVEDGLSQNMVYSIIQDREGFMWFGTQDGLNRYDGNTFKIYKKNGDKPGRIGSNGIFSMVQDCNGIIWIGTADGVYAYDPLYESFHRLYNSSSVEEKIEGIVRDLKIDKKDNLWMLLSDKGVCKRDTSGHLDYFSLESVTEDEALNLRALEVDNDGNVWIASYHHGLIRLEPSTRNIMRFNPAENGIGAGMDINEVVFINSETLVLGTVDRGMQSFNINSHAFTPLLEKDAEGKPLFVRRILRSHNGDLWIGAESGVYIMNPQTKSVVNLRHIYNDPYSISDNAIHSMCQDREGGIWLGTFFGGVNYFSENYSQFEKFYPLESSNTISGKSISEFCEDNNGNIWIGTEDAGLNLYNPADGTFRHGFIPANNIHALFFNGDELWAGTFSDGLYRINTKSGAVRFYKGSQSGQSLGSNDIYSIYKDYAGEIWIGTMTGLYKYNAASDSFSRIQPERIKSQVNDIAQDYKGLLWFATIGDGVFCYDKYEKQWKHYPNVSGSDDAAGKFAVCILQDSRNRLWIGTEGSGIVQYDREDDSFIRVYTTSDGLPNDVIYRLVEDNRGEIWGSTNKGLFKLDTRTDGITVYTHANGLLGDQFNYKSGMRSANGKLYFGGVKGFISFFPDLLRPNDIVPPVIINSLQIYNREVEIGGKRSPLSTSVTHTENIELPYSASIFSIGFSVLSYVSPGGNRYAYKLEGWDKEWVYGGNDPHRVSYSNLRPGEYVFRVKASNSDGLWNEAGAVLNIKILPPFYRTVWAYMAYALLVVIVVLTSIKIYLRKIEKRNLILQREFEDNKEKELYNAKFEFFTNVTHEIRTPLSLIKGPLDEVMKHIEKNNPNWENLSITQRNANRLLKLVNQLLDFRKAESKVLSASFVRTDIVDIIKETAGRFIPSASIKGINFALKVSVEHFEADIDVEIFTKILSNIFNNALKHAGSYVEAELKVDTDIFIISVSNDGASILPEYGEKIFEPFFKIDNTRKGSGLGLPFARSLVELHHGRLYLGDNTGRHITFVIEIPIRQENVLSFTDDETTVQTGHVAPGETESMPFGNIIPSGNVKTILSVEDNEEFQNFLTGQLTKGYKVLKASNGKQAIEILQTEFVDIVISDVMMPVMDGIALCSKIKQDLRYSHIPVILLTAKTNIQSKIEGVKTGADEYIEKPYSIDYLRAKIESLLDNREKILESYKHSPELTYNSIAHSKADEEFLNTLVSIIHNRIEEPDLDVDTLASSMNMSRATFYRKVKNISELTPNDFIKLIRLKRAAELLRERQYRVNEIAFIVGFRSSSYFSKCFFRQFGVLPKDFR